MTTVKERALAVGNRLGVKVIPRIPDTAKRWMSGGRAVCIDGNTLDPTLQVLLAARRVSGVDDVPVDDPFVARTSFDALCKDIDERDVRVAEIRQLPIPGPDGVIPARHYRPTNGGVPAPLVVFFHGGGWVLGGGLDNYDSACRMICRDAGVHVLAVDYRLSPEHPAPAAVDDAYAAYRWAREHAFELGADPRRVAVGGDSAGGNLAAVVTRLARDAGDPLPALQWLIYPATEIGAATRSRSLFASGFILTKQLMDWFEDCYVANSGVDADDPRVSPLLAADLSGLSPALIITAGFDVLRDEGDQYAIRLGEAGVAVDHRRMSSMTHLFLNLNILGGGVARANAEMLSALRAHLTHP